MAPMVLTRNRSMSSASLSITLIIVEMIVHTAREFDAVRQAVGRRAPAAREVLASSDFQENVHSR